MLISGYVEAEKRDQALELLDEETIHLLQAGSTRPSDETFTVVARGYIDIQEYEKAEHFLTHILSPVFDTSFHEKTHFQLRCLLVDAYVGQGDEKSREIIELLQDILQNLPKDTADDDRLSLIRLLGRFHIRLNQLDRAINVLEDIEKYHSDLALRRHYFLSMQLLADVYRQSGAYTKAIDLANCILPMLRAERSTDRNLIDDWERALIILNAEAPRHVRDD